MNQQPWLNRLRDIHLPEQPPDGNLLPFLTGLVLFGLLLALALFIWRRKGRKRSGIQREFRQEVDRIQLGLEQGEDPAALLRQLSALVRRLVMTVDPHKAGLCGEAWLLCLDEMTPQEAPFSRGPGQLLKDGPYCEGHPSTDEIQALLELVRTLRGPSPC